MPADAASPSVASPRRVLLYMHHDRDGLLDPHVLYQIRALHDFGIDIIFISNSPVSEEDAGRLAPFIRKLKRRPNEGYDWSGWKEGLLENFAEILRHDELILMNDSCYGPLFPLQEVFAAMDKSPVDFWGLSENDDPRYPPHVQSYFYVFRRALLHSALFARFWKNLPPIRSRRDAIAQGELFLTPFFQQGGYTCGAYIDKTRLPSPSLPRFSFLETTGVYGAAPSLVRRFRLPFVKTGAFRTPLGAPCVVGTEFFQALEASGSEYPVQLIADHLRRTRPLSWHKALPDTLAVLDPDAPVLSEPPGPPDLGLRLAVFANFPRREQAGTGLRWLEAIPWPFDLYVAAGTKAEVSRIRDCLDGPGCQDGERMKNSRMRLKEVRVLEKGSLLDFGEAQERYDLALHLSLPEYAEWTPAISEGQQFLLRSALASPGYVAALVDLFVRKEKVGLVFPVASPVMLLGEDIPGLAALGGLAMERAWRDLLEALSLKAPTQGVWPMLTGPVFWYRPSALRPLWQGRDFLKNCPAEGLAQVLERALPYIVQGAGCEYRQAIPAADLVQVFRHYEDALMNIKKQNLSMEDFQNRQAAH